MTPRSRKVCVGCRAGYFEKTVAFPFGRRRRQYSMEDMPMTSRLRFGVFLAPFHKPGINPTLGACPNSGCSILSESDSSLGYEQVFSPLEYRSDAATAAACAGFRAERPCLAVYR